MCQLCSSCICTRHRVIVSHIQYKGDRPLGGIHCQCSDFSRCGKNQAYVMRLLEVPEDMPAFKPKGSGGKGSGKGGKGGKGKSKHKGTSKGSSSSSGGWQPSM